MPLPLAVALPQPCHPERSEGPAFRFWGSELQEPKSTPPLRRAVPSGRHLRVGAAMLHLTLAD